jgi:hypothetical protein
MRSRCILRRILSDTAPRRVRDAATIQSHMSRGESHEYCFLLIIESGHVD